MRLRLLSYNTRIKSKLEERYRRSIRENVRGYWAGLIEDWEFYDGMYTALRSGVTVAWHAGLADCGIKPDEMTPMERGALEYNIRFEQQWVAGFEQAIREGSKANGGKLKPLFQRAEVWIGRWSGVRSEARAMACADEKLEWVLGPSEESCPSCSKLAGKVKRASWWHENGILPRVHDAWYLACGGWRCRCELVPTEKPLSRGRMPGLP
jgi:hypothetical protein